MQFFVPPSFSNKSLLFVCCCLFVNTGTRVAVEKSLKRDLGKASGDEIESE